MKKVSPFLLQYSSKTNTHAILFNFDLNFWGNSCYYEAAWKADNGMMDPELVAMAKWFAGEAGVKCADETLQIHGGYGYLDDYKAQRIYRDAKIVEIYEGTKEIEKLIVARALLH